ncbi:MAG: AMP-binding protein [Acidimicrobiia bacterium]
MEIGAKANADRFPDRTAVVSGELRSTWKEWNGRMCQLARALLALGLAPGDKISVLLHNCPEFLEVANAVSKARLVMVPLNYRLRGREIEYIVKDSDSRMIFFGAEFAAELEPVLSEIPGLISGGAVMVGGSGEEPGRPDSARRLTRYEELLAAQPETEPDLELDVQGSPPGQTMMIYTSGTTGRPKGVDRPTPRDPELLIGVARGFGLQWGSEVHLVPAPLYHGAPTLGVFLTIALGGTLVLMERFDAERFLALVEAERITSTFVVPTMLQRILALPEDAKGRYDLSSLRSLIVGAAPLPLSTKLAAISYFGPCLYEYYGSTDAGLNTILSPAEQLTRPASCGRVLPGNHIKILGDNGTELPRGEIGDIYVTSSMARTTRYYKDPEKTRQAFRGEYMTVGDMGYLDEDDYLYLVDRKADMVISGGVNVYPAEIEEVIHGHPAVLDVAVIGVPNEDWGEELKALVQLKEGTRATAKEILGLCRDRLADYKTPRSVDFVVEIPRNPSGKILKRQIRAPYWEGRERLI